jgi:hypothetical protein
MLEILELPDLPDLPGQLDLLARMQMSLARNVTMT